MNERGTAPSIADHVEETGCFVHPVSSRFRAREHPYPCHPFGQWYPPLCINVLLR